MFIAMWNQPGCLPEMDPVVMEGFEEAKGVVVEELENRSREREDELIEDMGEEDEEVPEDQALTDYYTAKGFAERQTEPFYVEADGMAYTVSKVQKA